MLFCFVLFFAVAWVWEQPAACQLRPWLQGAGWRYKLAAGLGSASVQQQVRARCLNPHIKMLGVMVFNKSSSSVSRGSGALQPQGIGQLMSWALSLNHGNRDWADASLKGPDFLSSFCAAFACLPIRADAPGGAPERKNWLKEDHVWDSWGREEGWSPLSAMALAW